MSDAKYTRSEAFILAEWQEVQAAQANPARFGPLYERYYEPIFRFIYQRTQDEELCADLCAQTFLKAMQKLDTYQFKGLPFSAWLYRIAANEVAQHYRQSQKKRVVAIEDNCLGDIREELEDHEGLALNMQLLQKVITMLEPEELLLIELRFFEKRAFKEVADILDMTENNAKVKLYRLLQKMRRYFGEWQDRLS